MRIKVKARKKTATRKVTSKKAALPKKTAKKVAKKTVNKTAEVESAQSRLEDSKKAISLIKKAIKKNIKNKKLRYRIIRQNKKSTIIEIPAGCHLLAFQTLTIPSQRSKDGVLLNKKYFSLPYIQINICNNDYCLVSCSPTRAKIGSQVYRLPLPNIDSNGGICFGTYNNGSYVSMRDVPRLVKAFFEQRFIYVAHHSALIKVKLNYNIWEQESRKNPEFYKKLPYEPLGKLGKNNYYGYD